MPLDEFVTQAKADLERFQQEWRAQHAKDPETFPMEMPGTGDWDEQMLFLLEVTK
jgi:hypothetical protein